MKKHKERKKLPHQIPPWVQQGARHFITINCLKRGEHILTNPPVPAELIEGVKAYEASGKWYVWQMVVMPDHLHLIATFDLQSGIKRTVSAWKRYQARKLGIKWQPDFFEHRLRNDDEAAEKSSYIRMNPVRKGLASNPSEWPHIFTHSDR